MQVNLQNFQGNVQKSATVYTNDPQRPQFNLTMKTVVKPFIQVKPTNVLLFRGFPEQIQPQTVDLITTGSPFHILKMESNLQQKIIFKPETVEDGKFYRLQVSNTATGGNYSGFILIHTDHPQRPEIRISVTGAIDTEISVSPLALFIGRTAPDQPLRTGDIRISDNRKKPFKITRITYDDKLIAVAQESLASEGGYVLRVTPRMENIPKGEHRETTVNIETDVKGGTKDQVRVNVVNH